jgi:polar amino acid transport system permease protein
MSVLQYYTERHFARGAVRNLPPTPFQKLKAAIKR